MADNEVASAADGALTVAEHLGCPLLRGDPFYIQPDITQLIAGYDAHLGQFLKDATEWGAIVLFDGTLPVHPDEGWSSGDIQSYPSPNCHLPTCNIYLHTQYL